MGRHRRAHRSFAVTLAVLAGGVVGATVYAVVAGSWRAWPITVGLAALVAAVLAGAEAAWAMTRRRRLRRRAPRRRP